MTTPWIIAYVVLAAVVAVQTAVVLGVLRRVIPLLDDSPQSAELELGGLPLLSKVAPLDLTDQHGERVQFPALVAETTIVLLMENSCIPCRTLSGSIGRSRDLASELPIVAILDGDESTRAFALPDWVNVLYGERSAVATAFGTSATPFAFVLDPAGVVIERGVANDRADLHAMTRNQKGGGNHQHQLVVH